MTSPIVLLVVFFIGLYGWMLLRAIINHKPTVESDPEEVSRGSALARVYDVTIGKDE